MQVVTKDKIREDFGQYMYAGGLYFPDTWNGVVYDMLTKLIATLKRDQSKRIEKIPFQIMQIKEKYGGLRCYISPGSTDEMEEIIEDADNAVVEMCADCGTTEEFLSKTPGWIRYVCKKCYNKELKNLETASKKS